MCEKNNYTLQYYVNNTVNYLYNMYLIIATVYVCISGSSQMNHT